MNCAATITASASRLRLPSSSRSIEDSNIYCSPKSLMNCYDITHRLSDALHFEPNERHRHTRRSAPRTCPARRRSCSRARRSCSSGSGSRPRTARTGAFEGTGLTAFHYAVLALLEEDPRETQAQIADALGYDRSHIVRLLDELEERELVIRKRDPDDRRRHVVKLTAGRPRQARGAAGDRARMEDEFLAPLDAEQRQRAVRACSPSWRRTTTRAARPQGPLRPPPEQTVGARPERALFRTVLALYSDFRSLATS